MSSSSSSSSLTAYEANSFFNRTNQLRAFALFVTALVAIVFLVRIDEHAHLVVQPMSLTSSVIDSTGSSGDKFLDGFRSNSRLVPLRNNDVLKGYGFINTFKAKYQLIDDRQVSKNYKPPSVKSDGSTHKSNDDDDDDDDDSTDDAYYLYSIIYNSADCSGVTYAISGAEIGKCNAVPNNGDDDSSPYGSYFMDCDSGDVVMNMYTSTDCTFPVALSTVVGSYGTCTSPSSKNWLTDARAPFTDENTISISQLCSKDTPMDISNYVVFKYHTGDALDVCMESPTYTIDSDFFEAYPVGACVPASAVAYRRKLSSSSSSSSAATSSSIRSLKQQTKEDDVSMSFEMGFKPTVDNVPFANVYSGSDTCDSVATTSVAPTGCYGDDSTGFYTSVTYFI